MELRQLKYFVKTQELLSFTDAAKALHISQSTLSQQIKQLEIELDVLLFNRVGKHITLTEAGTLLIDYAVQSIRKAEEGKIVIRDMKDMEVGTIVIGVAYALNDFFVNCLTAFTTMYPKIKFKIIYEPSHDLVEKLLQSKVDFVLAFHEYENHPDLIYESLFSSPMVLAAASSSPVAASKKLSLEQLSTLPLIITTKGFDKNHIVHRAFSAHGLKPDFSIEVNDLPTTIKLIASGNWYSVLIKVSIQNSGLVSIPIDDHSLTRKAKLIALKDTYETHAVKRFKELLVAAAENMVI